MAWYSAAPARRSLQVLADLLVVGFTAASGFTMSLVLAAAAFDAGPVEEAARLGVLMSLGAAALALLAARLCRVERRESQ